MLTGNMETQHTFCNDEFNIGYNIFDLAYSSIATESTKRPTIITNKTKVSYNELITSLFPEMNPYIDTSIIQDENCLICNQTSTNIACSLIFPLLKFFEFANLERVSSHFLEPIDFHLVDRYLFRKHELFEHFDLEFFLVNINQKINTDVLEIPKPITLYEFIFIFKHFGHTMKSINIQPEYIKTVEKIIHINDFDLITFVITQIIEQFVDHNHVGSFNIDCNYNKIEMITPPLTVNKFSKQFSCWKLLRNLSLVNDDEKLKVFSNDCKFDVKVNRKTLNLNGFFIMEELGIQCLKTILRITKDSCKKKLLLALNHGDKMFLLYLCNEYVKYTENKIDIIIKNIYKDLDNTKNTSDRLKKILQDCFRSDDFHLDLRKFYDLDENCIKYSFAFFGIKKITFLINYPQMSSEKLINMLKFLKSKEMYMIR